MSAPHPNHVHQHCQIIPDDLRPEEAYASSSTTVTISVQAFTPILGTLLLSNNPLIGGAARQAVVDLLSRMRKADDREQGAIHRYHPPRSPGELHHPWDLSLAHDDEDEDDETPLEVGLFGRHERAMFIQELLHQVVIGMARLDQNGDADSVQSSETVPQEGPMELDRSNPYFPPSPPSQSSQSSGVLSSIHPPVSIVVDAPTSPQFASPQDAFQAPSPGAEYPPATGGQESPSTRSPASFQGRQIVATGAHPTLSSSVLHGPEIDADDELYVQIWSCQVLAHIVFIVGMTFHTTKMKNRPQWAGCRACH